MIRSVSNSGYASEAEELITVGFVDQELTANYKERRRFSKRKSNGIVGRSRQFGAEECKHGDCVESLIVSIIQNGPC